MPSTAPLPDVKRIGETGQVSVGKALAGKLVRVEPQEGGVLLRFVVDVPEGDAWWTQEPYKTELRAALLWARENPAQATDLGALMARAQANAKNKSIPKAAASSRSKRRVGAAASPPLAAPEKDAIAPARRKRAQRKA